MAVKKLAASHDPAVITIGCPTRGTRVAALSTEAAPVITGGYGGWERIARPRRVSLTDWQGTEPFTMTISLRFDGYGRQRPVERALRDLQGMAVDRASRTGPPPVLVAGSVPLQGVTWVIDALDWGDSLWNARGERLRQDVTVTLLEFVQADLVALSPAKRAVEKAAAKRPKATVGPGRGKR